MEQAIDIHEVVQHTNASHSYLRRIISGSLYPDDLALWLQRVAWGKFWSLEIMGISDVAVEESKCCIDTHCSIAIVMSCSDGSKVYDNMAFIFISYRGVSLHLSRFLLSPPSVFTGLLPQSFISISNNVLTKEYSGDSDKLLLTMKCISWMQHS